MINNNLKSNLTATTSKYFVCFLSAAIIATMFMWSCEEDDKGSSARMIPYDPSKPVVINDIEPVSGGLATKVFISGSNFGTDLSRIKVYFGDVEAHVVGTNGEHLYVVTPRQDDGNRLISVVSHGDSTSSEQIDLRFRYTVDWVVRTIAGRRGTANLRPGTLAEAEFHSASTITADSEGNVFMSHWRHPYAFVRINEEQDIVEILHQGDPQGAPTVDADGIVSTIADGGGVYYTFNPIEGFAPRVRTINHNADPTIRQYTRSTMHSLAAHPVTGNLYTREFSTGHIIMIDKDTRNGYFVSESISGSDSYLVFDPNNPNLLYMTLDDAHCIGLLNLETNDFNVIAGAQQQPGWQDGTFLQARFNRPSQIIVGLGSESLYIADRHNHCIRELILPRTLEDGTEVPGMVQTIIGKGGQAGHQDGNRDDALFEAPRGIALLPDGTIYISEWGQHGVSNTNLASGGTIRKLTRE